MSSSVSTTTLGTTHQSTKNLNDPQVYADHNFKAETSVFEYDRRLNDSPVPTTRDNSVYNRAVSIYSSVPFLRPHAAAITPVTPIKSMFRRVVHEYMEIADPVEPTNPETATGATKESKDGIAESSSYRAGTVETADVAGMSGSMTIDKGPELRPSLPNNSQPTYKKPTLITNLLRTVANLTNKSLNNLTSSKSESDSNTLPRMNRRPNVIKSFVFESHGSNPAPTSPTTPNNLHSLIDAANGTSSLQELGSIHSSTCSTGSINDSSGGSIPQSPCGGNGSRENSVPRETSHRKFRDHLQQSCEDMTSSEVFDDAVDTDVYLSHQQRFFADSVKPMPEPPPRRESHVHREHSLQHIPPANCTQLKNPSYKRPPIHPRTSSRTKSSGSMSSTKDSLNSVLPYYDLRHYDGDECDQQHFHTLSGPQEARPPIPTKSYHSGRRRPSIDMHMSESSQSLSQNYNPSRNSRDIYNKSISRIRSDQDLLYASNHHQQPLSAEKLYNQSFRNFDQKQDHYKSQITGNITQNNNTSSTHTPVFSLKNSFMESVPAPSMSSNSLSQVVSPSSDYSSRLGSTSTCNADPENDSDGYLDMSKSKDYIDMSIGVNC